jgi:hypothetical protein
VFRGFHAAAAGGRRVEYDILWLFRRPVRAVFDPLRGELAFPALFPDVAAGSALAAALDGVVAGRERRDQPAHKRVDRRRLRLRGTSRRGVWSLALEIRGANHGLGVRTALAVVNELYVTLLEFHPDYLIARFGLSPE